MTTPYTPLSGFGPGVIGEDAYAAEQKVVARGSSVFGPGVLGEPILPAPVLREAPVEPTADPLNLSIAEMAKQLATNPLLFEEFLLGELNRPLPRKGALRALLEHEQAQATPRAEVVTLLEQRLAPVAS